MLADVEIATTGQQKPQPLGPFARMPVDIVVIGRREAIACPFPVLIEDLTRALAVVTKPAREGGRDGGGKRGGSRTDSLRGDHA